MTTTASGMTMTGSADDDRGRERRSAGARTSRLVAGRAGVLALALVGCDDPRLAVPAPDPALFQATVYPVLLRDSKLRLAVRTSASLLFAGYVAVYGYALARSW